MKYSLLKEDIAYLKEVVEKNRHFVAVATVVARYLDPTIATIGTSKDWGSQVMLRRALIECAQEIPGQEGLSDINCQKR